jgi:hypothetical protein
MLDPLAHRGALMKRTSESEDGGLTSTVLSISRDRQSISCSANTGTLQQRNGSLLEPLSNTVPRNDHARQLSCTHAAVTELKKSGVLRLQTKVRKSKYLNNLIEQDHRRVKQRLYPMLGFKNISNAAVTVSGIELVQKIRKGQFDTSAVTVREGARAPHMWDVVIAA